MSEIERILKTIPSTHVPIGEIDGKTYHYMCKEDIAKALEQSVIRARIEIWERIQLLGYKSEDLGGFGNDILDIALDEIAKLKALEIKERE